MKNDRCSACNKEGAAGPMLLPGDDPFMLITSRDEAYEDALPSKLLLFLYEGELFCNPCYCVATNTCVHCGESVDVLLRDDRCISNLYICVECIKGDCPHLWPCYSNGCLTPGEIAYEEYKILQSEEEDNWWTGLKEQFDES